MRNVLYIREEEKQLVGEDLRQAVNEAVTLLEHYLEDFIPKTFAYTKHAIMGPVGKLLSLLVSGRFSNKDALIGYIINVHKNTAATEFVEENTVKKLSEAVDKLLEIKSKVSVRTWLKILSEIDYAIYKKKFENILQKIKEKEEKKERGG